MSVDNFRVYDIRMLPAQEIKTIYDAFIFPLQDTTCHVWNCISVPPPFSETFQNKKFYFGGASYRFSFVTTGTVHRRTSFPLRPHEWRDGNNDRTNPSTTGVAEILR